MRKTYKKEFIQTIEQQGWEFEHRLDVGVTTSKPGPIDATYLVGNSHIALEWETGNISSSHRAVNKMISCYLKVL